MSIQCNLDFTATNSKVLKVSFLLDVRSSKFLWDPSTKQPTKENAF